MRRALILIAAVGCLAACGGSGTPKDAVKITLGRAGGLVPFTVMIAPGGVVTTTGSPPAAPTALTSAQDESLSRQVRYGIGKLKSVQCSGTFPDEATYSIAALGKTITVRGTCETGFTKLWNALTNALGLNA